MKTQHYLIAILVFISGITLHAQDLQLYMSDTAMSCEGDTSRVYTYSNNTYPIIDYKWNTGDTTEFILATTSGDYIVTVTDSIGNVASDTTYLHVEPSVPIEFTLDTYEYCAEESYISLSATPAGGYFMGDNIDGDFIFPDRTSGKDYVVIYNYMDSKTQCISKDSTIVSTYLTTYNTNTTPPSFCPGSADGSIQIELDGGKAPYQVRWSNGLSGQKIENLPENYYSAYILDSLGCKTQVQDIYLYSDYMYPTAEIKLLSDTSNAIAPFALHMKNASKDYCDIEWIVYDANQRPIGRERGEEASFVLPEPGQYYVSLMAYGGYGEGQDVNYKDITVNVYPPEVDTVSKCDSLDIWLDITHNLCQDNRNGMVKSYVKGGLPPYRYLWNTTKTNYTIDNLSSGIYSCTVTDYRGCTKTAIAEVKDSSKLQFNSISYTEPTDCNTADGSITIDVTGGVVPYNFKWSNDYTQNALTGLASDYYTVTVTDKNGCSITHTLDLNSTDIPYSYIEFKGNSNCKKPDGFIDIYFSTNQTIAFWDDIDTAINTRSNLAPGTYTLNLKDTVTGCSKKQSIVIEEKVPKTQDICIVTVSPETGKNLVVWEPVQSSETIEYYTIYKEDTTLNEFVAIADVPSENLSVFRDEESNPEMASDRYKISATNYCGNESELSDAHKTINFKSTFGLDEYIELIQDFYEGSYVDTYTLYATTKLGYSIPVASFDAQSKEAWINKFIPDETARGYYILVQRNFDDMCIPFAQGEHLKSDSGPFSQSLSNIAEAELNSTTAIDEAGYLSLSLDVFPNPTVESVSLTLPEDGMLIIVTIDGKSIIQETVSSGNKKINNLESGIYLIKLEASQNYFATLIVE